MSEPNWANRSMWPGDNLNLVCAARNFLKGSRALEVTPTLWHIWVKILK